MIYSFGQTPSQLLKTPHPKRKSQVEIQRSSSKPFSLLENVSETRFKVFSCGACTGRSDSVVCINVPRLQGRDKILRFNVQEGTRYKVQEGVLYNVQSPFFGEFFQKRPSQTDRIFQFIQFF